MKLKISGLEADSIIHKEKSVQYKLSLAKVQSDYEDYCRHFMRSSSTIDSLKHNDNIVQEDGQKAEILNNFFSSVLTDEPPEVGSYPTINANISQNVFDVQITKDIIMDKMMKLKRNQACGVDGIHVNVLSVVQGLSIPLTILFKKSVNSGVLPQD